MSGFCRKFWAFVCCKYSKIVSLKDICNDTRLLPLNEKTHIIFQKDELHCFGVVPLMFIENIVDISKYYKFPVKKISCGDNHCLILFSDGQLAGFGENELGQLGFEIKYSADNFYTTEKYTNAYDGSNNSNEYIETIKLHNLNSLLSNMKNSKVIDIACGEKFSLIIISHNQQNYLIKFGINVQEKYSNDKKCKTINILTNFGLTKEEKEPILKNVCCKGMRSILSDKENRIYIGGIDFYQKPLRHFKKLDQIEFEIKSISLGNTHCLLLDVNGWVHALGDNTYGELGIEKEPNFEHGRTEFRKIDYEEFEGRKIVKIVAGGRHSLALLDNGELYSFGDNSEGQCTGEHVRNTTPHKIELLQRNKIIDVYAGDNHNVLITETGEVYSWGDASCGKLGSNYGNVSLNQPKIIPSLKGKDVNCVGLGVQMTVISTSQEKQAIKNTIAPSTQPKISHDNAKQISYHL